MVEFVIDGSRKDCGEPAFSPFPTMFSKGYFPRDAPLNV